MLPLFAKTVVSDKMRKFSNFLSEAADSIDECRKLTASQKAALRINAGFKNIHKGQSAFVIVNGPSLASQNIAPLKKYVTFAVSGFWKHEVISEWQPTYYSLLDANFFRIEDSLDQFYKELHERITTSTFFVPLFRGFDAVQRGRLPIDRTKFVASIGWNTPGNDLTTIVQSFASVSAFALSQAIYMGCDPIYLLGFDHDYLANRGVDRHFYKGGTVAGHHLVGVPLADRIPYDEEMRANIKLWNNYRRLKSIADRQGIRIFNATPGSYLDVFPRIEYEQVLKKMESTKFKFLIPNKEM
jgi:hypothetical protein